MVKVNAMEISKYNLVKKAMKNGAIKKLLLITFTAFVFTTSSFYFFNFLIPKIVVIEHNPGFYLDLSHLKAKKKEPVFLELLEATREKFISSKADFLEVNLDEMKVRLYREGLVEKEVPIMTKGDPQGWGGSAIGLYKIMSGAKSSYSIVSEVYMPYALRYYGMYYIHGEPYYPWGGKLISSVSGGCLRLKDKDAAIIYDATEINMPVLVIGKMADVYDYSVEKLTPLPKISAQSYLAADLDSGFVFAENNSLEQLPIASLAKFMTAIVVTENIDLRKAVLVKKDMLNAYGSTEGLEPNKWFRVVELFHPLLIESSNDAAEVLSHFLGREKTIRLMNEKAEAILMKNTKFVDPSGFDPENKTTARDLFHLARYLLNNRLPLLEITKGKEISAFGRVDFDVKNLWNKNIFISDQTFVGGKTGFIETSKNTALFIFRLPVKDDLERNVTIILLNSKNNETDTQKIYKWLQENYFKPPKDVLKDIEVIQQPEIAPS